MAREMMPRRIMPSAPAAGLLPMALVLGVALLAAVATAQAVPDGDTLLLVHFDRSTEADYAVGSPAVDSSLVTTGDSGGRFGGGVELAPGSSLAVVGDDGNFSPPQGTIEFWIKPHWPGNTAEKHSFFTCRTGETGYININTLGGGRLGIAIRAGEGDAWRWRRADGDISAWQADTWHHAAFAWGEGQLHVYLDGQESPRQKPVTDALMPDKQPQRLQILGCDAALDDFRISRRMFTADDARRSIDQAQRPPYRYLSDLPWTAEGEASADGRLLLGNVPIPLIAGGRSHAKGLACGVGTKVVVPLERPAAAFRATVGVCPFSPPATRIAFELYGDDRKLLASEPIGPDDPPVDVDVSLSGVKQLALVTRGKTAGGLSAHGIWASPVVVYDPQAEVLAMSRKLGDAELAMVRRQQEADNYRFQPPRELPYLVVPKDWEDEIDPTRAPAEETIGHEIGAFAAPGEYEPVNFVVYAREDLRQVSVEVTDLRSGDKMLPSQAIDVRLVLRRLMRDLYTLPPERSTVVSRFLLANQPVDIPAGTFREYHLIVHVPEDAAPGQYTGQVRIDPARAPAFDLPLAFEVLPIKLRPLEDKGYGVYYRFPPTDGDWSRVDVELADIRAHGANMVKCGLSIRYVSEDGRLVPHFDVVRRGLELLKKHGFHGPLPIFTGCPRAAKALDYDPVEDYDDEAARARFFAVVKEAMEGLVRLNREFPQFELMPTQMDEIFGRGRLMPFIRYTQAVRQVPSLRVFITLHNDPGHDVSEMMRQVDPFVDVRCYNGHCMDNFIRAGNSFDDLAKELQASGDEAWLYHNIRGAFFPAEWTRLVNGFYLWISPLKVHVPWMYYSYKGNPFDATDGPRRGGGDFAYAVPDPANPSRMVPTRHWEGFREGIDDIRYLKTLQGLIAEKPDSPAAGPARVWLAKLRSGLTPLPAEIEPIDQESPLLVLLSRKFDGRDYRRIRRQAAEHIQRLSQQ